MRLEGGLGAPCPAAPSCPRLFLLFLFYNPSSFLSLKNYLSWWREVNSKSALAWPRGLPADKHITQTLSTRQKPVFS